MSTETGSLERYGRLGQQGFVSRAATQGLRTAEIRTDVDLIETMTGDYAPLALDFLGDAQQRVIRSGEDRDAVGRMIVLATGVTGEGEKIRAALAKSLNDEVKRLNGAFGSVVDPIKEGLRLLKTTLTTWTREEEQRVARERATALAEQQRLEAAARRQQQEADRLALAAQEAENAARLRADALRHEAERASQAAADATDVGAFLSQTGRAQEAEAEAHRLEQAAVSAAATAEQAADQAVLGAAAAQVEAARIVIPAAPSRTVRSDVGQIQIKMRWTYEITSPQEVPRAYCSPDPAKIRAEMRSLVTARKGTQDICDIPGVRIFQEPDVAATRSGGHGYVSAPETA